MKHSFDIDVAKEVGVNAAVIFENLCYWIQKNEANEKNFYDGNYWTYNSRRAFAQLFPYMSERQIRTAMQKLVDAGLVVTGVYNNLPFDRTLWYGLSECGKAYLHLDTLHLTKKSNGEDHDVQPIPDSKPAINSLSCKQERVEKTAKRFSAPTCEEVKAYCSERGNSVDAERFVNYYTANGWMVGKHKMKDWKAAVRTWESNGYSSKGKQGGGDELLRLIEEGAFDDGG